MTTLRTLAVLLLLAGAASAQTWLTDPAFGAQRNAYGPGVHMDATGRAYGDTPSNAWVFEPVRPNAYDLGDVDALRQRPTRARTKAATVTRLRDTQKQRVARGQAAGSCTAGACDDGRGRIKPANADPGG
jgi:hypothetical protein